MKAKTPMITNIVTTKTAEMMPLIVPLKRKKKKSLTYKYKNAGTNMLAFYRRHSKIISISLLKDLLTPV